jgi:hypothetical protein
MLYQFGNRTLEISIIEFLALSDSALEHLCITENTYHMVQNPFSNSVLQDGEYVKGEEFMYDDVDDDVESVDIDFHDIGFEE